MKKNIALLLCILWGSVAFSQEMGIKFTQGKTLKELMHLAKTEKKFLFIDCNASWCAPCRYMNTQIFSDKSVGKFFNSKFVCASIQMDTGRYDNANTKKLYADAAMIANTYKIRSYPTFLYFSPTGELMHKVIGATPLVKEFLDYGKIAVNEDSAFYVLEKQYKSGLLKNPKQLYLLATTAALLGEENMNEYARSYIATQKDMYSNKNIDFLKKTAVDINDTSTLYINANERSFDLEAGWGSAELSIINALYNHSKTVIAEAIAKNAEPDWLALEKSLYKKFPKYSSHAVLFYKVLYYEHTQRTTDLITAAARYCTLYPKYRDATKLNEWAWSAFLKITDKAVLNDAAAISRQAVGLENTSEMIETYACLLYKIGNKDDAIVWEKRAIAKADIDVEVYKNTLDQMEKDEKIWENKQ